jgi:hypothetical protein
MRPAVLLLVLAAGAAPPAAAEEKIGQRTASPEAILAEATPESADSLDAAIAAAAAHPLGSLANPVRVGGPAGALDYLARLRCADGAPPRVGAHAPGGVGAYGSLVELYPLDCGRAAPGRVGLHFDYYFEERPETGAPAGFRLAAR